MEPSLAAPAPTPTAYPATPADPTKVSGRRFGAYLIDYVLLMGIIPIAIFFAVSQPTIYTDSPSCNFLEVRELVPSGQICIEVTGTEEGTWVLPNTGFIAAALYLLVFLIAIEWLLQASTGKTIGKLLFGIRTVNASGTGPGVGKQFVRGLVWIIDSITLCIPIAAWSILLTKRNQRLGDLAAGTFVVRSTARGIAVPGAPAPVTAGVPAAAGAPAPTPGYPVAPPVAATPDPALEPAVEPAVEPVVEQETTSATGAADGGPQWDPARNAYIQWDPNQGTWLMYDDAASAWKPIS